MDIDLNVLRVIEREREIPLETLIELIEQALFLAYQKTEGAWPDARAERGSTTLAEIVSAADEGRVDTLYLPRDRGSVSDVAFADRALASTLAKGGSVRTLSSGEGGDGVIATYRH